MVIFGKKINRFILKIFLIINMPMFKKRRFSRKSRKGKHLTKSQKVDVKKIVERRVAKSMIHNAPGAPGPAVTGLVANIPTSIIALSNTNQGLNEYNRRGDQIWIDKIKFRCYVTTSAANDALRLTVLRQPRSGFPPSVINASAIWQNYNPGVAGYVSGYQDDQPCQVLLDRRYVMGDAAGMLNGRYITFTLDYSKRPLRVVYQDGSVLGSLNNTVLGGIELFAGSINGTITLTYTYDVVFHEK